MGTFQAGTGNSIDYKVNDCWGSEVDYWLMVRGSVASYLPNLVMSSVLFAFFSKDRIIIVTQSSSC
jgi:hypothetical protein